MKRKLLILFSISLLLIASVDCQTINYDVVKISVKPEQAFIEQTESNKFLNFDFLLENTTDGKLTIESIKISVFDDKNRFVTRKVLDNHGLSPAIYTIPKVEIEARKSLLLFNPFYVFDGSLDLTTLRYEFLFFSETKQSQYESAITVKPIYYQTKTNLIIPLKGRMMVEAGHDFYSPHRRIDMTNPVAQQVGLRANSGRFANDLTICNEHGELFKDRGKSLEEWFAYEAMIYAPGSGKIVALVDEIPENRMENGKIIYSEELSFETPGGIFGNYLVIDHGNGEFSLFAHLKQGGFKVRSGQAVKQNQPLARIGFSGNTDFIHTHYQLQNSADPLTAEGLPAYFNNFNRIIGSKSLRVKRGNIDSGDIIESK